MIVIVMGVSGVGKTTIGTRLASLLGWRFMDADEHHPAENVVKMTGGTPLTDDDRWPWLDRLNALLREKEALGESAVLACSALREAYRQRLTNGLRSARIVFLHGDENLLRARLAQRQHRYMPASLLSSQFATLEPPADALRIVVSGTPESCVDAVASGLGLIRA